jgi:hypothetical protein
VLYIVTQHFTLIRLAIFTTYHSAATLPFLPYYLPASLDDVLFGAALNLG